MDRVKPPTGLPHEVYYPQGGHTYGAQAYQDYTRKSYVTEAIQHASFIQKQVADNAFNALPFNNSIKNPPSKYATYTVGTTNGIVEIKLASKYFNNQDYYLVMVPVSSTLPLTPGVIPSANIVWGCRSATNGGNHPGYQFALAQWLPESCKYTSMY